MIEIHQHFSFPSGHSISAFALFGFISIIYSRTTPSLVYFGLAASVAISRIYLKQHFFEDIYAGIEFEQGSEDNNKFLALFKEAFPNEYQKIRFPDSTGIGIKSISQEGTSRLVRAAIKYAIDNNRKSLTLVHKGNIMKFTEGAFRNWGYQLAEQEFPDNTYTWDQWERTVAGIGVVANTWSLSKAR